MPQPSRYRAARLLLLLALTAPLAFADQALRVVTWNLETLGPPGSSHYQVVAAVLGRLDAEMVALQEIASSADAG